jgi:polysaccharide pyruvyl transferase WcaK-like protein/glycosyltransferase involved in cell wall biosynthesis
MHGVQALAWDDIPAVIEAVEAASLVLVGGGGLFQDYWGAQPAHMLTLRQGGISEYGAPVVLAHLLGKPSMLYAVGVGPLFSEDGRQLTCRIFSLADAVSVRDRASLELLEGIGCRVHRAQVGPDPAFSAPAHPLSGAMKTLLEELPRPRIAVNLRYWDIDVDLEAWLRAVAEGLDEVLGSLHGSLLFIPFQQNELALENDAAICQRVIERLNHPQRARLLPAEVGLLERFELVGRCELVLGMRLHSLIGGMRRGVPGVGLAYDPKVRHLLVDMGLGGFALGLEDISSQKLAQCMLRLHRMREQLAGRIEEVVVAQGAKSATRAARALGLLQDPPTKPLLSAPAARLIMQHTRALYQVERKLAEIEVALEDLGVQGGVLEREPSARLDAMKELLLREVEGRRTAQQALQAERRRVADMRAELAQLRQELREAQNALGEMQRDLAEALRSLDGAREERNALDQELTRLRQSRGYRLLRLAWGVVWRVRDPRHLARDARAMAAGARRRVLGAMDGLLDRLAPLLPARLRFLRFVLRVHHQVLEDRSTVTLYSDDPHLFPQYQPRQRLDQGPKAQVKVTLVTTVRDEADNAPAWLADLERQTRVPDEIILLDGGSQDGTWEVLQDFAAHTALNMRLVRRPGTNIATRRNLGVSMATHPVIAMTDFGCTLDPDWLENLLLPFQTDPQTEVVAGWYRGHSSSSFGRRALIELLPRLEEINPQEFLPACRSIAFRREAWEKAGGFPEWVTKTGEDTYFDVQLKRSCRNWAFVPSAQVVWHAPATLRAWWRKLTTWSVGDGETGLFAPYYGSLGRRLLWQALKYGAGLGLTVGAFGVHPLIGGLGVGLWLLALGFWLRALRSDDPSQVRRALRTLGQAARVSGFLQGIRNRPLVAARRYGEAQEVVFFLTGVPIDDTGGGARGTQMVLELLRRKKLVVFVHMYPKQESVDLGLDFRHPHLLHFAWQDFDWPALQWELQRLLRTKPLTAILEFPFAEYLPVAEEIAALGGTVVYDLIDAWDTSLGGEWYSPQIEAQVIRASHVLVASAPVLVERLRRASGRDVLSLPNAVNLDLFDRRRSSPPPADLPPGEPRLLYIGALWGEWFDWELLGKLADAYPEGEVVVIGDYRGQRQELHGKVHFLGLKPQVELPAYLQHCDVAIIPWEISPLTNATSPLKVFEYLAMGKPVVAPSIEPLQGIPYVYLAHDHAEFLEQVERALECKVEDRVLEGFLQENSWAARIDVLERAIATARAKAVKSASDEA